MDDKARLASTLRELELVRLSQHALLREVERLKKLSAGRLDKIRRERAKRTKYQNQVLRLKAQLREHGRHA